MSKKAIFGNLLGIVSISMLIIGIVNVFKYHLEGLILIFIGLVPLFVAIYLHGLIRDNDLIENIKEKPETTEDVESKINRKRELAQKEKEYELYLDAKTALMVEAFAVLTNKRMKKDTRAKKLRKIIKSDPFNIDKFEE